MVAIRSKSYITVLLHVLVWMLFAFMLLFYQPLSWNIALPYQFWVKQVWVLLILISIFYLNSYIYVPRLLLKNKNALFALLVSAQALKFRPDSSLSKQYQLVPDRSMRNHSGGESKVTREKGETEEVPVAAVWVLRGQQLVQQKIKTGLNDNTHVEVLSGLKSSDVVVTGAEAASAASAGGTASPFMPKRPGGGGRR